MQSCARGDTIGEKDAEMRDPVSPIVRLIDSLRIKHNSVLSGKLLVTQASLCEI